MSRVRVSSLSVSLDGYMAGPRQSAEHPLGVGGERLHSWAFKTRAFRKHHGMEGGSEGLDDEWAKRGVEGIGATIMGRNMFGPVRGPWRDDDWKGWWGDDPPFHHPVFVLTHHPRADLHMAGGTTFHFVTEGVEAALARARAAAKGRDVRVGGGADTIHQLLRKGLIDEMHVVTVPLFLGSGESLFDGAGVHLPELYEVRELVASESVVHSLIVRRS